MDIILLNILLFNDQITMGCKDRELNMVYLLGKLTRAFAGALMCDYKLKSLLQLKQ